MMYLLEKGNPKKDTRNIKKEDIQTHPAKGKSKCVDLAYLNKRTKSNPELMMEMIELYLKQTLPLMKKMRQSLNDKDWDALYSSVHKLIPSFSLMGIQQNSENTAKKIQEYASTQQHLDEVQDLVLHLEIVCSQACEELEEELMLIKKTIHVEG